MKPMLWLVPVALLVAGCEMEDAADGAKTGAQLYGEYCAACHGPTGTGALEVAGKTTPDLTVLAKNNGGVFPAVYVMSTIDGYARDNTHGPMPRFGDLLDSQVVEWVDPDGVPTPTPQALLSLASYLEGFQS
ncbi:MAG: c-type cytochrome [Pseudomonadota bacterium]|nr:c-type cytochrome [Pseudomonadota bacterium]